jgi:hypothetical protein
MITAALPMAGQLVGGSVSFFEASVNETADLIKLINGYTTCKSYLIPLTAGTLSNNL